MQRFEMWRIQTVGNNNVGMALDLLRRRAQTPEALTRRNTYSGTIVAHGHRAKIEVSREEFEACTADLLGRTLDFTRDVLGSAKDKGVHAIWVDTDGCVSAAEYCDVLLTSVMKGMDVAVESAIKDSVDNKFSNDVYVGTLANNGVGLAPYHDADSTIDQDVKDKIEELKQQIIDGTLKVG